RFGTAAQPGDRDRRRGSADAGGPARRGLRALGPYPVPRGFLRRVVHLTDRGVERCESAVRRLVAYLATARLPQGRGRGGPSGLRTQGRGAQSRLPCLPGVVDVPADDVAVPRPTVPAHRRL